MKLNTDINILGSLTDWDLISWLSNREKIDPIDKLNKFQFTSIKTTKSFNTTIKVLNDNYLTFDSSEIENLSHHFLKTTGITNESLIFLFWNASSNNRLLFYLNERVYFPAFFSGRLAIKNDEVVACIKDLRQKEDDLKKWSESTLTTTSSKYLTLLKKFGLMEGSVRKRIVHPYLTDELFILFIYWISAKSEKSNLINSPWLPYCFSEKQAFLDRLLQKKFSKYFNVVYTGDKLSVEPLMPYELIYEYITKSGIYHQAIKADC